MTGFALSQAETQYEDCKCHPNSLRRVYTRKIIEKIRAGKNPRIVTSTKRKGKKR